MPLPTIPYRFTKDQRKGIIALCLLIIAVQVGYFVINSFDFSSNAQKSEAEKQWLAHQAEIDALKAKQSGKENKLYPFNPNFISDYKGYTLGMSVKEIDKLKAFRDSGKYINSVSDFKKVTGVSDSILNKISPYFKFPDWVNKKQPVQEYAATEKYQNKYPDKKESQRPALDINTALEEDLINVYGIGPAFAKKILRRRADLGAFVSMEQMDDFKEFSPEALASLNKSFIVGAKPQVTTINVNTASLQQLARFPYFNRDIAKAIITERSMTGKIANFDELIKINDIFNYKSKIIRLYLDF
jgi:DNA uptake protein ComE-like DNA-binding protein